MTLPTFLGIGAPRSGSTWLHKLLASHPEIFMPTRRKEINFFDRFYGRGLPWYENFFPAPEEASRFQAIGEISPHYLYCAVCPERIKAVPSIEKLILMLRNPVDRLYSAYTYYRSMNSRFPDTFEAFLKSDYATSYIEHCFYSRGITNYLNCFNREQMLILVLEETVVDVPSTKSILADFLAVKAEGFPDQSGRRKVNKSERIKCVICQEIAMKIVRTLHKWDMDWTVNLAHKLGLNYRLFGTQNVPPPTLMPDTKAELSRLFAIEIDALESLLDRSLECWRS